ARLDLTLAELERDKYVEGEYEVEYNKIKGAIELAEKDLQEAQDKLVFFREYEKKGFGTPEQTRIKELFVEQYKYMLREKQNALMVLEKFTLKLKTTELNAKAKDAGRELVRKTKSSKAAEEKARSDLDAAVVTARLEKQELDRNKAQLDKCIMTAPQEGILVYAK